MPSSDWVSTEIRVRYAETDQMGIVYYSNYLIWFEVGRTDLCRQRGLVYKDFEEKTGTYLAVAEVHCRYHSPARYDDVLLVRTRVQDFRKRTVRFQYQVIKQVSGSLVASGSSLHVIMDKNGRPKSFPAEYSHYLK